MKSEDIRWICWPCGNKYGTPFDDICTAHEGTCSICKTKTVVTSGRKFRPYNEQKLKGVKSE